MVSPAGSSHAEAERMAYDELVRLTLERRPEAAAEWATIYSALRLGPPSQGAKPSKGSVSSAASRTVGGQ